MRWAALPLHIRLALGYTLFFALALALLSAGVYFTLQTSLQREIADTLGTSADLIQQDFDLTNDTLTNYFTNPAALLRTHPPQVEGLEAPSLYIQAVAPDGTVVVRSANTGAQTMPIDKLGRQAALAGTSTTTVATLGSASILMLTRPLSADGVIVGTLQVAHPLRELERTLRLLLISLLLTNTFALFAAVRAGGWLAQRALAPVGQIAATARQIVRAEDLTQRVPPTTADDEIGQLSRTINEMLGRLETLFTAQKRFVADVSHELRTPLTALQGNLELLRRNGERDLALVLSAQREVQRLVRLTNDLVVLAQADNGLPLRCAPIALDELVLDVVRDLRPLAGDVALVPEISEQVAFNGDYDRLKQVLINLVANGVQHTPAGGRVVVALEAGPGEARLQVRDNGSGIAPADLPHIFDRFYRAEQARSRSNGGAGLGLSIVQRIVAAHGGQVNVTSVVGSGTTFSVMLPL